MEKENWIEQVLESTNGITAVMPDAKLFAKIQRRIKAENTVSTKWVWAAAASIAILISLNMKLVSSRTDSKKATTETIAESLSKSNQLY